MTCVWQAMRAAASSGALPKRCAAMLNLKRIQDIEECHLPDHKQEEAFRVIDRRPFTAEGELRKEVVEQEEREAAQRPPAPAAEVAKPVAAAPAAETPKHSPGIENLIRMLGSNAAMALGAYADPRTGEPVIELEKAR